MERHKATHKASGRHGTENQSKPKLNPSDPVSRSEYQILEASVEKIRADGERNETHNRSTLIVAVVATVLSLLGAAGTIWQAIGTADSAAIARRAARPWVTIEAIDYEGSIAAGATLSVRATFAVTGGSPAINITSAAAFDVMAALPSSTTFPRDAWVASIGPPRNESREVMYVGKKADLLGNVKLTDVFAKGLKDHSLRLFVTGLIEYSDQTAARHRTSFCYENQIEREDSKTLVACSKWNEAD